MITLYLAVWFISYCHWCPEQVKNHMRLLKAHWLWMMDGKQAPSFKEFVRMLK